MHWSCLCSTEDLFHVKTFTIIAHLHEQDISQQADANNYTARLRVFTHIVECLLKEAEDGYLQ